MAKTVVGLFKSATEAQNIKHELVNDGYSAENIRVVANDGGTAGYTSGATSTTQTAGSGTSDTGVMGSIKNFFSSFTGDGSASTDQEYYTKGVSQGGALLMVTVADERADALASKLKQYGAADVNKENAAGVAGTPAPARAAAAASSTGSAAIPIVEEELQVGKREVQRGGVRVYSHVVSTPVEEEVRLREEHVRIQRNAVNRPASEADFQAFKEGSVEMTETAEEAVISKQARVVEEVTVGKDVTERTQKVKDTLRHTEVDVEELPGQVGATSKTGATKTPSKY